MQILIVDDDTAITDVIHSQVDWEKLGISEVFEAYNMKQAQEVIATHSIDIVVSDIEMPQASGIDLLEWYREENYEGEFLFLTNYESFDYAKKAIRLRATEYLLKPFDVTVMEAALQKIIKKNHERKMASAESEELLYRKYLSLLLEDPDDGDRSTIEANVKHLPVEQDKEYTLVVSRISNIERDKQKIHSSLLKFMVTNVHSEILLKNLEATHVVEFDNRNFYMIVTICEGKREEIVEGSKLLVEKYSQLFSSTITCMVCNPCKPAEFHQKYQKASYGIVDYVLGYGKAFVEDDVYVNDSDTYEVLDLTELDEYLENKEKVKYMVCLREKLNDRKQANSLNAHVLTTITQEIIQSVYYYLAKRGISAAELFNDRELRSLSVKASQSLTDIIKWVNYLLDITFACEDSSKQTMSLSDRINQYVAEHYSEDIGRNEIAAEFFLNPEYLAKVYKKATGVSLKDYINEYRIRQAKLLLQNDKLKISDISDMVGFNNFTYFSTCFKKYTGETPNQYRGK